jgi:large subunit ribosomal protein L18
MKDKNTRYEFRKMRTRRKVRHAAKGTPRLSVNRTLRYLYAQVVDDIQGKTLVSASSRVKEIAGTRKTAKSSGDAKKVGELIAKKALEKGITKVVFDRGGVIFHGRIKALADAARSAGLKF